VVIVDGSDTGIALALRSHDDLPQGINLKPWYRPEVPATPIDLPYQGTRPAGRHGRAAGAAWQRVTSQYPKAFAHWAWVAGF
jgi:hypothetical protein